MTPERHTFSHRGLRLSYLDSDPNDHLRPAVLLLHGFPDHAEMWQAQIQALHQAGFRCIAPDTVGCGHSEIAPNQSDYHADDIISDHLALLKHLKIKQSHVVGHDWGAVIAWLLAAKHPSSVQRLAVMSVGHPTVYARAGWGQKRAGWYTLFFQLRGLADRLLVGNGRFSLGQIFGSHPNMDDVMSRLRQAGRMRAAVRIYRANFAEILLRKQPPVTAPTLGLWSAQDAFLTEDQMRDSAAWVNGPWRYQKLDGGHWMSLSQTETVNALLLEHFCT